MSSWTIIGTISGTSADGIDIAEIETDGHRVIRFGAAATLPYRTETRRRVLEAAAAKGTKRESWPEIAAAVTADHATTIASFLSDNDIKPDAVVFHGQTVWHDPGSGETVQLGKPQVLADELGLPVIGDVRLADMAAGGQGAPLVPVYHRALAETLIAREKQPLCFLNIGGVSNLTYVEGDRLAAFDIGPGNALLDDWVRRHEEGDCDLEGRISARGDVDEDRIAAALQHSFLKQRGPKSLDRYSFSADFVEGLSLEDGAATLVAFTARTIASTVTLLAEEPMLWLVCGGGRHNPTLMAALSDALNGDVVSSDDYRIDGDTLEAQAMAFLGARLLASLPTSYPETTGAREPVCGGKLYAPAS